MSLARELVIGKNDRPSKTASALLEGESSLRVLQVSSSHHQEDYRGILPRFWHEHLRGRWGKRLALSLFAFLNGGITTGVLALLAHWTRDPLIFPSLGPTAFLLFHRPLAKAASPRNALLGHLIGILAGWLSLAVMGLVHAPPILETGVTWPHVASAALSIGLTSGLMILLNAPSPPASATTLIISLGLIHEPWKYPILLAGATLLIVQGFIINRAVGIPYPLWDPVDDETRARYPSFS
jgi:CBS domain-containing membrane protein